MKKFKFHYGWVVAACCMLMMCSTALVSTGMGTNLNAMRQHLGFTNTQTSLVLTIRSITAFFAALLAGYYYRIGLKKGMVLAMAFGAMAFAMFILAGSNVYIVYIGAVLSGICYSYGMMMPISMILKQWFNQSRGTALAIASAGTGLMSLVFAPLVQSTIDNHGIKAAFILQACFMIFVGILLAVFVVEKPEDKGLEPVGGKDWKPQTVAKTGKSGKEAAAAEPREAVELPFFWIAAVIFAAFLVGTGTSPASANFTNNLVTAGLNAMDVAKAISVYGAVIIVAKLVYGMCIDKLGTFKTTLVFGTIVSIGTFILCVINFFPSNLLMYIGMIVIGIGCPVQTLGYPNWIVDLDSRHYNKSLVKCQTGYQLGAVIGSFFPGIIADATGAYAGAYFIFFVVNALAIVIVFFAYRINFFKKS